MRLPIGASDYYELYPSNEHESGDIWAALPTHGVLSAPRLPAVVITPACDLLNRKVETLTYLPIISVRAYLASRSHLPEILRATNGQLEASGCPRFVDECQSGSLPRAEDLLAVRDKLIGRRTESHLGSKEEAALIRADAGLRAAAELCAGRGSEALVPSLRILFGNREFQAVARHLVTNSHRADLHFLPCDEQRPDWSLITEPSLALFRYPLSIPIDILDTAQVASEVAWPTEAARLRALYPCVDAVLAVRPMKVLRIRPRFLSDLLTRFTGLYGRIGSPDFGGGTVTDYVNQIASVE